MFDKELLLKDKIVLITILLYVIYSVFPLFSSILSLPPGVINIIVSIILFAFYPKAFFNKTILWFLLYVIVIAFYVLFGKAIPPLGIGDYDGKRIFIIEVAFILPPLAIWSVLRYKNSISLYNTIQKTTFLFLFLSFLYLIPLMVRYENLLRSTVEGYYDYHIKGLPNYALVHAYVLLSPCVLFAFKKAKGKNRLYLGLFVLLLFFIILFSYVSAIIFILAIVVVVSFVISHNQKEIIIVWLLVLLIVLVLLYAFGIIDLLLDQIAEFYRNTPTYSKIIDVKGALHGNYNTDRTGFHKMSWDAFVNNSLVGSVPVGNHSSILDRLGGLGLLGFVPFMGMFFSIIKTENKHYSRKANNYYYATVLAALILLFEKGLFGAEGWLFFVVLCPVCLTAFDNNDC